MTVLFCSNTSFLFPEYLQNDLSNITEVTIFDNTENIYFYFKRKDVRALEILIEPRRKDEEKVSARLIFDRSVSNIVREGVIWPVGQKFPGNDLLLMNLDY